MKTYDLKAIERKLRSLPPIGSPMLDLMRKLPLSRGELQVIAELAFDPETDGEIVQEGLQVYVGSRRTSATIVKTLNQRCYLHREGESDDAFQRFTLNSDVLRCLIQEETS